MRGRNSENGRRRYTLVLDANADQMRAVRNLCDIENIPIIKERHIPKVVHLAVFLVPILLALYLLTIYPQGFAVWFPLTMLIAGRSALEVIEDQGEAR